jgi:hypothetical protein
MATPVWLAATTNQATQAGQVNQFLGTHAATIVYTGVVQSQQTTAGSGSQSTQTTYIGQKFTSAGSQTTIGRAVLTLSITGTPPPVSVSIQADSSGKPSGTPLVSTLLPRDFLSGSSNPISIPLPAGISISTAYWIVMGIDGSAGNVFNWFKSNQASGCSTSTDGITWTTQTFGLLYQVFDYTLSGQIIHTWEDLGARWTLSGFNGTNQLVTLSEYTQGQTQTGYLTSNRALGYASGNLVSIT